MKIDAIDKMADEKLTFFRQLSDGDGKELGGRDGPARFPSVPVLVQAGPPAARNIHGHPLKPHHTGPADVGGVIPAGGTARAVDPPPCIQGGDHHMAFADNVNVTGITIPDGVRHIGRCAFEDCSRLKSAAIQTGTAPRSDVGPKLEKGCDTMGKLFRFELSFFGEPQGVGFLQGLDDVGLRGAIRDDLYALFDSLPIHELDQPGGVSFWFTEEGIRKYEEAIKRVADAISGKGWELIGASINDNLENAVYKDRFQVAFPLEYIRTMQIEYADVPDVDVFVASV